RPSRIVALRSLLWLRIGVVAVSDTCVAISYATVSIAPRITSTVTGSTAGVGSEKTGWGCVAMAHSHLHLTDRQIGSMPVAAVSCKAPDNRIPMPHYDAALSLRDARGVYFAANNLGEGGYQDKWVKLALGPVRFAFPHTAGRVRAGR